MSVSEDATTTSAGACGSPTELQATAKSASLWLWDIGPLQYQLQQQQQQAAAEAAEREGRNASLLEQGDAQEGGGSSAQEGVTAMQLAVPIGGGGASNTGGFGVPFPSGRLSVSFGFERDDADGSGSGGPGGRGRESTEDSMLSAVGNDDVCSVSSNSLHGDETPRGDDTEGAFFGSFDEGTVDGGTHRPLGDKLSSFYGRVLGTYRAAVQEGGVVLQHTGFDIHNIPVHQQGDSSMYDEENLMKRAALQSDPATNQLLQAVWDAMPKVPETRRSPNTAALLVPPAGTPRVRRGSMSTSLSAPPSPGTVPLSPRGDGSLTSSSRQNAGSSSMELPADAGYITFNVFRAMSAYVFRRLVPNGNVDDFLRHCEADWKQFSAPPSPSPQTTSVKSSRAVMNKSQFFKAMFAVADVWTTTADAEEYHHFMDRVLLKQAKKISLIDPSVYFDVQRNVFAKGAFHKRRGKKQQQQRRRTTGGSQTPSHRSPAAQTLETTPPTLPLLDTMAMSSAREGRDTIAATPPSSRRSRMPSLALDVMCVEPQDGRPAISGTVLNAEQRLQKLFSALAKPREDVGGAVRRKSRQAVAVSVATFDPAGGQYTTAGAARESSPPAVLDARIGVHSILPSQRPPLYANPSAGQDGEPPEILNPAELTVALPAMALRSRDVSARRQLTSIVLVDDALMSTADSRQPTLPVFTRRDGSHVLVAASSRMDEAFQCIVEECTSIFSWCEPDATPPAAGEVVDDTCAVAVVEMLEPLAAVDTIEIPSPRGHKAPPTVEPQAAPTTATTSVRKPSRSSVRPSGAQQELPHCAAPRPTEEVLPPLPLLPTPPPQPPVAAASKQTSREPLTAAGGSTDRSRSGRKPVATPQGVFSLPFELKPNPASMKGRKFARHRLVDATAATPTPAAMASPTPTKTKGTASGAKSLGVATPVATPTQSSKRPHPPTHHSTRGPLAPKFPFEIAPSTVVARSKHFRQECGEVISDDILLGALERRREEERFQFATAAAMAEAEAACSRQPTPVAPQLMLPSVPMMASARRIFTPEIGITSHQVVGGMRNGGPTATSAGDDTTATAAANHHHQQQQQETFVAKRTPRLGAAPDGVRGTLPPGALRQVLGIVPRIVPNTKCGKIVVVAPDPNPLHPAQRHQTRGTIPSAPRGASRHPVNMKVFEPYDRAYVDHLLSGPLLGQAAASPSVLRQQRRAHVESTGETLEAIVCNDAQRYPKSLSALAAAAWSLLEEDGMLFNGDTATGTTGGDGDNGRRCLLTKALPTRFQTLLKQIGAPAANEDAIKQATQAQVAQLLSSDNPDVLLLALVLAKQASIEASERRLGVGAQRCCPAAMEERRLTLPAIHKGATAANDGVVVVSDTATSIVAATTSSATGTRSLSPQHPHGVGGRVVPSFDETLAEVVRANALPVKGGGGHLSGAPSRHLVVPHTAWSSLVHGGSGHTSPTVAPLHHHHQLPALHGIQRSVVAPEGGAEHQHRSLLDEVEKDDERKGPSLLDRPELFSARLMSHAPKRDVSPAQLFCMRQRNDPALNPAVHASAYRNEQRLLVEQLMAAENEKRQEMRNALIKAASESHQVPSRLRQHAAQAGRDMSV